MPRDPGSTPHDSAARVRDEPWPSTEPPLVRLVALGSGAIDALADGDLGVANERSPVTLGAFFVEPGSVRTWGYRSRQIAENPDDASWITRAIYDPETGTATGLAGFHGPPDARGMVEVGYAVDPGHRRRGYARAALTALLDRARSEPSVRVVRASIRPDNLASRGLVAQFGFAEAGEQWDAEDGIETIFELRVG